MVKLVISNDVGNKKKRRNDELRAQKPENHWFSPCWNDGRTSFFMSDFETHARRPSQAQILHTAVRILRTVYDIAENG